MARKFSLLHLLPHSGGGVGTVIRSLLEAESVDDSSPVSSILSLERLNEASRRHFDLLGIPWVDSVALKNNFEILTAFFEKVDIVLVHWWNHPFLVRLLFQGLPLSRIAIWSHVNGFAAPQSFFPELFELPDRFIFATEASLQSKIVEALPEEIKNKLRVIRSCAGIPAGAFEICKKYEPFQFGYVGTVEPAKMHPDFLKICASANIPAKCIVAGGPSHKELRSQADLSGLGDKFDILGPIDDPVPLFKSLHVFAYPLNPSHYGTGEQVLIEAMAYGAVPVVFANPPEKALIRHEETGLIVNNAEEFSNAIRFLADNTAERERLAEAGRQFVLNECDIKISTRSFHTLYEGMLSFPKSQHRLRLPSFEDIADGSPFHLFLASCGSEEVRSFFNKSVKSGVCLLPPEFTSSTRGTPLHYLHLLGNDPDLEHLCRANHGFIK